MGHLLRQAKFLLSEAESENLEVSRAEVAFIGRSNVGKSSLINALCEHPGLAKVSQTPGRTQTINVFAIDHLRWLIDLPGYGYAAAPLTARAKWSTMIESYLQGRQSLKKVFLLIDSKVGPTDLDQQMRRWLDANGISYRVVATKLDQVKSSQRFPQQKRIGDALDRASSEIRWVSSTNGIGLAPLRQEVIECLTVDVPTAGD